MQSPLTKIRDLDKYILKSLPDRELFNIMLTNKQLLEFGEEIFKQRLLNKYPLLAKFKSSEQTWTQFYLSMIFYIDKITREFGYDYVPALSYNPKVFYTQLKSYSRAHADLKFLEYVVETGKINLFKSYTDLPNFDDITRFYKSDLIGRAVRSGNMDMFKYLQELLNTAGLSTTYMEDAVLSRNPEMIKHIEETFLNADVAPKYIYSSALKGAILLGDMNLIQLYEPLAYITFDTVSYYNIIRYIGPAAESDNPEILDYFIDKIKDPKKQEESIMYALKEAIYIDNLDMLKHIVETYNIPDAKEIITNTATKYGFNDIIKYANKL